jgi:hypothetical protein
LSSDGDGKAGAVSGRRGTALLKLPVRLSGIQLGRPVDLLLDVRGVRATGFAVRCGDGTHRFLPFAAAERRPDELQVASALTLLDDVQLAFYEARGTSLRLLLGGSAVYGGGKIGRLEDVVVGDDGAIVELIVSDGGQSLHVPAGEAVRITPRRGRSAA